MEDKKEKSSLFFLEMKRLFLMELESICDFTSISSLWALLRDTHMMMW